MIFAYPKYKEICDDITKRFSEIASTSGIDSQEKFNSALSKKDELNFYIHVKNIKSSSIFQNALRQCFLPYISSVHASGNGTFPCNFRVCKDDDPILTKEGRQALFCDLLNTIDDLLDEYVANASDCKNTESRYPGALDVVAQKISKNKELIDFEVKKQFQRLADECKGPLTLFEKYKKCIELKELYEAVRDEKKLEDFCRKNFSSRVSEQPRIKETPSSVIADELFLIAEEYYKKDNIKKGRSYLMRAAEMGSIDAQSKLGPIFLEGQESENDIPGIPCDKKKGEKYLRSAAEAGNAKAMYNLGRMLRHGLSESGNTNHQEALYWYQKAFVSNTTPKYTTLFRTKALELTKLSAESALWQYDALNRTRRATNSGGRLSCFGGYTGLEKKLARDALESLIKGETVTNIPIPTLLKILKNGKLAEFLKKELGQLSIERYVKALVEHNAATPAVVSRPIVG